MAYFKKNLKKTIVYLHVLSSALWIGAAVSMVIITFTKQPVNISELIAYNWANKLIDD